MMSTVVSREEELASLDAFIDAPAAAPAALVLEGEAGIGKSTLWRRGGRACARAAGCACSRRGRPRPNAGLAHVGLGDLLEDVLDDVLPALSAPQRRALEVALLREDAAGDRSIRGRSASRFAADSQALAEDGRCSSRSTMSNGSMQSSSARLRSRCAGSARAQRASAARPPRQRRRTGRRARARRSAPSASSGCRWGRSASARCIGCCATGSGRPFARQTLLRIHEHRAGTLSSRSSWPASLDADVDPVQPLPVPETLEELVRARISGLPARQRLRRWHSPRRSARRRRACSSGRESSLEHSNRQSPRT